MVGGAIVKESAFRSCHEAGSHNIRRGLRKKRRSLNGKAGAVTEEHLTEKVQGGEEAAKGRGESKETV